MENYQPILFPYAYNILGSAEDAKDAVQDVLYKFLAGGKENVEDPKNYLIRSVINQSINIKQKKQKTHLGDVWLPEPVDTESADTNINLSDIVSYSLMILLEQLNARERAVFILKEAFSYSHDEIADTLSIAVDHSRKLLSRAKQKLNSLQKPVVSAQNGSASTALMEKFLQAIRDRDVKTLEQVMSDDIAFYADGGPGAKLVAKTCTGIQAVSDLLILVYHKHSVATYTAVPAEVNHQPALLYYTGDQLRMCQVFIISPDGQIAQICNMFDPEKLRLLGASLRSL